MMRTYFHTLSNDLILPLFSYFSQKELRHVMIRLLDKYDIIQQCTIKSKKFWLYFWKRDVSSLIEPKTISFKDYQTVFKVLSRTSDNDDKIQYLAKNGYDILLLPFLVLDRSYHIAIDSAAEYNQRTLICKLLNLKLNNIKLVNYAMRGAAWSGHKDLVMVMLQIGADNFDDSSWYAARAGHSEVVKLMIEQGIKHDKLVDYYTIALSAARGGHIETIKLMTEHFRCNIGRIDSILLNATRGGHRILIEYLLQLEHCRHLSQMQYTNLIEAARERQHHEIVKLLETHRSS